MSSKNVIVIGGGLAGLAAGVALAESGWQVKLFELRPYLGGRATSYVLPSGEHVDNCQHVTLGCCTNLDDFYRRVGSANKVKFFDRLFFLDPQGRSGAMQAGILPAPFHMTGSFATFAPLSLGDKLSIARAMMRILFTAGKPKEVATPAGMSMLDWLKSQKQTPRAIERFWRVVLVSALDEELDRTDARFGIDVFWKAFLSNRTGYRMGVPTVPLAELYDGCRVAIEKKGGEVALRAPVRGIRVENGAITAVQFDGGHEESADAYVFAVPHTALANLLPPEVKTANPALASLENIKVSPITGVHFWFDRPVTNEPFITLLDTTTQWVFNKSTLYHLENPSPIPALSTNVSFRGPGLPATAARPEDRRPSERFSRGESALSSSRHTPLATRHFPDASPNAGQYLQLVISASYDLLKKSREEIIDICLKEIQQALPAAREAQLVKATVIKEASATFSPEPGVDRFRPTQATNTPGLFLAGDWTATGWPATMEGAVRSGYLAAEAVLRSNGSPAKFLQPDLAPTGLSKIFA